MRASLRRRAATRDAQLSRLNRLTRRTAYAGVVLAGAFATTCAAALPGHSSSAAPRTQTTPPSTRASQAAGHPHRWGTHPHRWGTTDSHRRLQPPPNPPAPAPAPPMTVSGSS